MIFLGILYRVTDLLYALVLLLSFCETLTIRKNKILQILAVCLMWFMGTTPIYSNDVWNLLIAFGELVLFVIIFFSDRWLKKFLMLSFFYPFIVALNYLTTNLYERIFYTITGVDTTGEWTREILLIDKGFFLLFAVIRLLAGIGFYLYLKKYLEQISKMMTDKIWKVLSVILMMPVFSIWGGICFFPEGTLFLYPICIMIIFTEFASIYLTAYICRKIISERQVREMEVKQSLYEERFKEEERVRRIYHDMKNHFLVLQSQANNSEESQKMITSLQKQISDYEDYVQTGNTFLDVILRDKMKAAKEADIDFHAEIDLSEGGFLDGLDVSTIFGNALDNAIEACGKLPDEERFITVRAGVECRNYLSIQIENSADREACGENRVTTKEDTFWHGFGRRNIESSVEKYEGSCTYKQRDGIYTLSILIPIP